MDLEKILSLLLEKAVEYGPKIIGAILVVIIGSWMIKIIVRNFNKFLDGRKIDQSLKPFLKSAVLFFACSTLSSPPRNASIEAFSAILNSLNLDGCLPSRPYLAKYRLCEAGLSTVTFINLRAFCDSLDSLLELSSESSELNASN